MSRMPVMGPAGVSIVTVSPTALAAKATAARARKVATTPRLCGRVQRVNIFIASNVGKRREKWLLMTTSDWAHP